MPGKFGDDPPDPEQYADWYQDQFTDDLEGGIVEDWFQDVTDLGCDRWEKSDFWVLLMRNLERWDGEFRDRNKDYPLLGLVRPDGILAKPLGSTVNKSFRWNVFENSDWPFPPRTKRRPSTVTADSVADREGKDQWYGPSNWLSDFPDIFRVRLITTYFDGVKFLAEKVEELAARTTSGVPKVEAVASHSGYHAIHVDVSTRMTLREYEYGDNIEIPVHLEVQVITSFQETIMRMLTDVYANSRSRGPSEEWEWNHASPEFSVNYLGNALHYLEGMIVVARHQTEGS